jgi:aspartate dehydrogenase
VVLSVGALLDHPEWVDQAAARGVRIHAPSAAIAGLDGLKGAAVDGHLDSVVMETRKPPGGLAGAPGVAQVDLGAITAPACVFEGTAREACRAFPANVNVVAAVSLAGLGPDRTRIRILADPAIDRNRHTVTAEGRFGRLRIEIENVPSENPRTGKLSYLSTIAYLRDLAAPLRVGT